MPHLIAVWIGETNGNVQRVEFPDPYCHERWNVSALKRQLEVLVLFYGKSKANGRKKVLLAVDGEQLLF